MDHILLIDDDEQLSEVICLMLESEGFSIRTCADPMAAYALISREDFSAILLDIRLGEYNGVELLPKIREFDPEIPIFMITAHGEIDTAVQSFTLGANGYIRKPFQEGELKSQLLQAIENFKLKRELRQNRASIKQEDIRSIFLTRDPLLDPLIRRVGLAAGIASNVVITGETGSGKEVIARALHRTGPRGARPFIAFNCAAIPENLIESELFGHVRGAFTDARDNKPGLFVRANGGTLFLDEIGDAPLSVQAKLLRVLQEKEVTPLGGTQAIPVDVRLVSATHRCLSDEAAKGRFRQDLFYRLHVIPLHVPPLRERKKDIVFLAEIFARRFSERVSVKFDGFTPRAVEALLSHPWPGNVRELQNRMERALVLGTGSKVTARSLFPESEGTLEFEFEQELDGDSVLEQEVGSSDEVPTFGEAKISFEKTYLEKVLAAARGNIAKAARIASKSRTEVYGLIKKHQIDPGKFKKPDSDQF